MSLRELTFWTIAVLGALGGRVIGSLLGRRTGARHAVAWFGALAGFTVTVVVADFFGNMANRPGWGVQDLKDSLKDGQLAECMIYGAGVAFIVEATMSLVGLAIRPWKLGASPVPRPRQSRLRSALVIAALGGILYADFCVSIAPMFRWQRTCKRIFNLVDSLALRRPKEVTREQWAWVVGWTHSGVGNCFYTPSGVKDDERYYRFADELERRIQGKVDLLTIDWIWDEFEQNTKNGRRYSEDWRPTTPEHLREAGPMDFDIDVP